MAAALTHWISWDYSYLLLIIVIFFIILSLLVSKVIITCRSLTSSCLYYGRVDHARLKGGAMHSFSYPLFFSFIDIEEISEKSLNYWPIFQFNDIINRNSLVFCSLDSNEHLKGLYPNMKFIDRIRAFLMSKCPSSIQSDIGRIKLLTHLTYFGYCFNPLSVYYIYKKQNPEEILCIIAEVSNTPWIEQHPYALYEGVPNTKIIREDNIFQGIWQKEFHVSPFMEMDYKYNFHFHLPGDQIIVKAALHKESTNEVWFTAYFKLKKLVFSPINLLYELLFYPLHTRIIQAWIHWEAIFIFMKGIPTFEHPNKTDVDFGFGITGKRLGIALYYITWPLLTLYSIISSPFIRSLEEKAK